MEFLLKRCDAKTLRRKIRSEVRSGRRSGCGYGYGHGHVYGYPRSVVHLVERRGECRQGCLVCSSDCSSDRHDQPTQRAFTTSSGSSSSRFGTPNSQRRRYHSVPSPPLWMGMHVPLLPLSSSSSSSSSFPPRLHNRCHRMSVFVSRHNTELKVSLSDITSFCFSHGLVTNEGRDLLIRSQHVVLRECPFCHPIKNRPDNMYKLYIRIHTGAFFCHRCGAKGSWYDFRMRTGGFQIESSSHESGMAPMELLPPTSRSSSSSGGGGGSRSSSSGGSGDDFFHGSHNGSNKNNNGNNNGKSGKVSTLPMPNPRMAALYSSNLLDSSTVDDNDIDSGIASGSDSDDENNNNNKALDYLLHTRGLDRRTLRKYGVGRAFYKFRDDSDSNNDNDDDDDGNDNNHQNNIKKPRYVEVECVTFPWMMRESEVQEQEEMRGNYSYKWKPSSKASSQPSSHKTMGQAQTETHAQTQYHAAQKDPRPASLTKALEEIDREDEKDDLKDVKFDENDIAFGFDIDDEDLRDDDDDDDDDDDEDYDDDTLMEFEDLDFEDGEELDLERLEKDGFSFDLDEDDLDDDDLNEDDLDEDDLDDDLDEDEDIDDNLEEDHFDLMEEEDDEFGAMANDYVNETMMRKMNMNDNNDDDDDDDDDNEYDEEEAANMARLQEQRGGWVTRRIKVRAVETKQWQRLDPPGGGWGLFGWHTVPPDATELILTEGEYDAMAVYAATGRPAVSLPSGCRNLPPEVLPLLERFSKLILWMDHDGPGWEGAEAFARKLGLRRTYVVQPSPLSSHHRSSNNSNSSNNNNNNTRGPQPVQAFKDANDALLKGYDLNEILDVSAKVLPHERILTFADLRAQVLHEIFHPHQYAGVPVPSLPQFSDIIKGFRRGEMTVLTGPTGSGKTTFLGQVSLDHAEMGVNTLWGSFEIKNTRLIYKLMQQHARELIPTGDGDPHAMAHVEAMADRFQTLPLYFMKFHGGSDVDDVLDAMDYGVYVHDIEHIILDNMQFMLSRSSSSASVSSAFSATAASTSHQDRNRPTSHHRSVRPYPNSFEKFDAQDLAIEKFRKFATERNVHVTLVVHPRKENDRQALDISSIYGSAKSTQEADTVLILQSQSQPPGDHHSNAHAHAPKKFIDVRKNRFNGDLGQVPLYFSKETGRYVETPPRKSAPSSTTSTSGGGPTRPQTKTLSTAYSNIDKGYSNLDPGPHKYT